MTGNKRARLAAAALALGLVALDLILLLTVIHAVGTDDALYCREQMKADILPASWLSDADLRALDVAMAAYLAGDEAALGGSPVRLQSETGSIRAQVGPAVMSMPVFGVEQPVFNDREMAHMADCFNLFRLLRKVRGRLIPWAVVLILGGARLLMDRRRARLCAWLAPLILLIPLGLFAAYAAVDFNGAFTLFHRLLFRNELWLLDPATDLLIRICPASMFVHMGARIGALSLIAVLAVSAAATALSHLWPKGKEGNSWKDGTTRRGPAPKRIDFGRTGMR